MHARGHVHCGMLHGESSTDQASPRTPTQRTCQPQEAVQPQRNQTILQADTPAQKANYSHKRSHPTPLEADAHTSHVHNRTSVVTGFGTFQQSSCMPICNYRSIYACSARHDCRCVPLEVKATADTKRAPYTCPIMTSALALKSQHRNVNPAPAR